MGNDLVCVTGASGFIGTYVVKELLERGYRVRAAVRDKNDTAKASHVKALGDVELVSADLLQKGSFRAAFEGCRFVVHTASAVMLQAKDPQREIVDVAVDGTLNVLRSAAEARATRVVVTSSVASILDAELPDSHVFTEDDWNESITLKDPYGLSKVTAEKQAVKLQESLPAAERFELVHVHPSMVLGPVLARVHMRSSPSLVRDLLTGKFPAAPKLAFGTVDVREVATAHAQALEIPSPSARYICSNVTLSVPEMARALREMYPNEKVPRRTMPDPVMYFAALFDKRLSFSFLRRNLSRKRILKNDRIKNELGIAFRPPEESLRDTADSMISRGWLARSKDKD